jgi:hypothetical protein
VAISDGSNLTYINKQAWNFLRCNSEDPNDISKVHCLNSDSSAVVSPLEQLAYHVRKSDPKFANVETKDMIKTLSDRADREGLLLSINGEFTCKQEAAAPEQD